MSWWWWNVHSEKGIQRVYVVRWEIVSLQIADEVIKNMRRRRQQRYKFLFMCCSISLLPVCLLCARALHALSSSWGECVFHHFILRWEKQIWLCGGDVLIQTLLSPVEKMCVGFIMLWISPNYKVKRQNIAKMNKYKQYYTLKWQIYPVKNKRNTKTTAFLVCYI